MPVRKEWEAQHIRRLTLIFTIPLTIILVLFALVNRQGIEISLWPFPWSFTLPAFLLILGTLFIGFMLGGMTVWVSQHTQRHQQKKLEREMAELNRKLTRFQAVPERDRNRPGFLPAPPRQ